MPYNSVTISQSKRALYRYIGNKPKPYNNNYLITESEVVTGKSQTEALLYWPSDSEVNTVGRGLRFSRNDRMVEVIKLFIIWHQQQK